MKQLKRQIKKAPPTGWDRITRYFNNLEIFNPKVPHYAAIACASYGGEKLAVTYAERRES